MVIKPAPEAIMFEESSGDILEATHKGVTMSICVDSNENTVSIFSLESEHEGHGEAGEAIQELKKRYPDKEFYGSVPLNHKSRHLFDKHNIKYSDSDEI